MLQIILDFSFLSTAGIVSTLERLVMACTQFRQSPANSVFFGISQFALDGIKLFCKVITCNSISVIVLQYSILLLYIYVLLFDHTIITTRYTINYQSSLVCIMIASLVELLATATISFAIQNSFNVIAVDRLIILFVILEVTATLIQYVLMSF